MAVPIKTVTVYAGSGSCVPDVCKEHAFELGRLIAKQGWTQVNGGGSTGLMYHSTKGAQSVGGIVDSVIFEKFLSNNDASLFRHQVVCRTLPERKQGLFELGDAIVALPGGLGTLDELFEVCSNRQLSIHKKPIVILNTDGFYNGIQEFLSNATRLKFIAPDVQRAIQFADAPEVVIQYLIDYHPIHIDKTTIHSSELDAMANK